MDHVDPLALVLSRLDGVRPLSNGRYIALCPHHDDHTPSLCIAVADDGRVLLHDQAGCQVDDVVHDMGLELRDLFPPRPPPPTGQKRSRPPRMRIPPYDALCVLRHAATVTWIAAEDIAAGRPLSVQDIEIVRLAAQRIEWIYEGVRG
jgi:hypothetical protein